MSYAFKTSCGSIDIGKEQIPITSSQKCWPPGCKYGPHSKLLSTLQAIWCTFSKVSVH